MEVKSQKPDIIRPVLFKKFNNVIAASSTMHGNDEPPFYNNLSYYVGDKENNVKENRIKFFNSLGINLNRLAIPQQVHSGTISIADKPGYYKDTDGLITDHKELYLVVSTADCFPVLMFDHMHEIAAGIHSGWRGTKAGIVINAVNIMKERYGTLPKDILAYIGAGISCDKFEVGAEVAEQFEDKYIMKNEDRYYIDLKKNIYDQLLSLGFAAANIETDKMCTFTEEGYLHSYRRDKNLSGRMFSVIGMRS